MYSRVAVAGVALIWALGPRVAVADIFSEVFIGYSIAPVPLEVRGKTFPERVEIGRGSYYVNGPGGCAGCHTSPFYLPGGDLFLGQPEMINKAAYLGGGRAFGPFISRNITPDKNGRPAGLTFAEFRDVIRKGTDFKALPPHVPSSPGLLQVMPWPEGRHMTSGTLRAIYAYLSAVPCLEGGPGQSPGRCGP